VYVGHGGLCVCLSDCLSVAAFPHYCTDPDVTWEMVRVSSSCTLLCRFAIGARVSLLCQHTRITLYTAYAYSPNAKCQLVLVQALWLVLEHLASRLEGSVSVQVFSAPQDGRHAEW